MTTVNRRAGSALLATGLLATGTVVIASLLAGSLGGVPATASALGRRTAPDWLAVAALLLFADRSLDPARRVTTRTVGTLALAVFLGGVGAEGWPVAERLFGPSPLGSAGFLRGVTAAVQGALFPTALFLGAVVGTTVVRTTPVGGTDPAGARDRSVTASDFAARPVAKGSVPVTPRLAARTCWPLAVVAAFSLGLSVTTRLALGSEHLAFVVADAGIAALTGLVTYGVLAVALVAVTVLERGVARLAGLATAVWLGLFVASLSVGTLGALVGSLLTSQTTTPLALVERSTLAHWPSPVSATMLLGTGTFLAGAVGLRVVGRETRPGDVATTRQGRGTVSETGPGRGDPAETSPGAGDLAETSPGPGDPPESGSSAGGPGEVG